MLFAWCIRKYLFIKINNMNPIFKYNGNAKCSAKGLKVHILAMDFWFWRYTSMKKDCLLKSSCWISNVVSKRFYYGHGKYSPELSKYFIMRRCQLNFDMFCATSALGISWRYLNHPNMPFFPCGAFLLYPVDEKFIEAPLFSETSPALKSSLLRP